MNCAHCGATVAPEDSFCRACGATLGQVGAGRIPYRLVLTTIWLVIASAALVILVVELKTVIFEIVVAGFLALVLNPAVLRFQRWRLTRGQAIAVVAVIATVAIISIGTLIAAPLASQGARFAASAPERLQEAAAGKGTLGAIVKKLHAQDQLKKASTSLSNNVSKLSGAVLNLGRRVASAAFRAAIVLVLAIFMLAEGPRLVDGALKMIPPPYHEAAHRIGNTTSRVVAGYTLGVLLMASLNGAVAGVAMAATGTPFILPLATWAAVVDILPIVGGLLSVVPVGLFGFTHSLTAGITVVVSILVYQQIKNHVLYPVVVGRAVSLSSLLVLVSVLAGADLAGIGGAVLAIPVAGVLNAIIIEVGRWREGKRAEEIAATVVAPQPVSATDAAGLRAAASRFRERRRARKEPPPAP